MSRGQQKPDAAIRPVYKDARNSIIEPTKYVALSKYFVANWLPQMSANGLKILLVLRERGFFNSSTGEKREQIDIEQKEIAALCGMSKRTIQRVSAEDPIFAKYVQREFIADRDKFGRILREHYIYRVVMDDVLTPEDESRLEAIKAAVQSPICQNVTSDGEPKRQNGALDGISGAPMRQNGASGRQNVTSYKESLTTPINQKTLKTPAAPGDSSLSFAEPEKPLARARQNNPGAFDFVDRKRGSK